MGAHGSGTPDTKDSKGGGSHEKPSSSGGKGK